MLTPSEMQFARVFFLLVVLTTYASSQAFHTVTVGVKGSFYDPPTTNALEGDIITFVFGGVIHGVTQSSFAQPCSPLTGGFSSGLLGTNGSTTIAAPTWDLVISNASEPIWFFCQATQPESHCAAGMIGAINAPVDMFTQFQSSAKAVTGTPAPTPTVILSGIGAFATATPTTTSLWSPSASASETSSKKNFPVSAVAGGATGGGIAVVMIIVLLVLLRRQKKKKVLEGRQYAAEKEKQSPSTPRFKREISESATGSDMSESESGRVNSRVHRQPNSSGLSSNFDRESPMPTSNANTDALLLNNLGNRNHGDGQNHSIQNRYANSQRASSPITMADAFNLSPTPHPYAQTQYTQETASHPTEIVHRSAANVHEIAKEVAALIGSGHPMPPGLYGRPTADPSLAYNRTPRQLPNPRQFLRAEPLTEEPESPGLPRYER